MTRFTELTLSAQPKRSPVQPRAVLGTSRLSSDLINKVRFASVFEYYHTLIWRKGTGVARSGHRRGVEQ